MKYAKDTMGKALGNRQKGLMIKIQVGGEPSKMMAENKVDPEGDTDSGLAPEVEDKDQEPVFNDNIDPIIVKEDSAPDREAVIEKLLGKQRDVVEHEGSLEGKVNNNMKRELEKIRSMKKKK